MITPLEKAKQIYTDCFRRYALELSHDKNVLIAKSISLYVCSEVLGYMGADRGYEFWTEVKQLLKTLTHKELYESK